MVAGGLPTIHGLGSDLGGGNVDSNFPALGDSDGRYGTAQPLGGP